MYLQKYPQEVTRFWKSTRLAFGSERISKATQRPREDALAWADFIVRTTLHSIETPNAFGGGQREAWNQRDESLRKRLLHRTMFL